MRYHTRLAPFSRPGFQEGDGWFSNLAKKGISQGAQWLKGILHEKGPDAIKAVAEAITHPVINTGSNILDKIIKWSGSGLRLAGRYGSGFSVAGRGRSSSRSRSRSRSSSRKSRKHKKVKGSGMKSKSRSRSRSTSRSRSSSRKRKPIKGAGKKRRSSSRRKSSGKKKRSPKKGGAYTYRQLKPLLNRADF